MRGVLLLLPALLVGGCAQIQKLDQPEPMSAVEQPAAQHAYARPAASTTRSSLYRPTRSGLFTDRIALDPGDIVTVLVSINDRANLQNKSERQRTVGRSLSGQGTIAAGSLVGTGTGDASLDSQTRFDGDGATVRAETIRVSVAAIIRKRYPNGNLLVEGSQEVRVNRELRRLTVMGIIRPSDIGPNNTIQSERIAEARISYGGRGPIAEVQKPPYGARLLDRILPF